ncbi:MAG: ribosome maturation factor RimM [Prolixibacteraceae bacterium]
MTSTNKQDFFPMGTIIKPHGLRGEMVLEIEEGFEDILEDTEFLMVEVEGGLVPFFISEEGINFRTSTTVSLAFDDLETADKVRPFCGCRIFLPNDVAQDQVADGELSELMGYMVFDQDKGMLGKIIRVDDFSGNVVLTIQHGKQEILVPLAEDFITEFNEEKQELHLNCPEGLVDLYLE